MKNNKCPLCNNVNIPDSERDYEAEKLLALILPNISSYLNDPSHTLVLEASHKTDKEVRLNIWKKSFREDK